MSASVAAIEVVRGNLTGETSEEILQFWRDTGALDGESARELLDQVVCVAVDEEGEIVGANSVREESVPLIGRHFLVYTSLFAAESADLVAPMFNAAFEALEEEFDAGGPGPVGVCMIVSDREVMERRPEAIWADMELWFAGYLPDGPQLRIRYFWGAAIAAGLPNSPTVDEMRHEYPLQPEYRIEPLAESSEVTREDVLNLWGREGVLLPKEALRRVHEVQLVAVKGNEGVVGLSTAFLQRNAQLGIDLWHYRTFVAEAHRQGNLAAQLIFANRELLERRFSSGEDTRGGGVAVELENEDLKRYFNKAVWPRTGLTFIGENERGDHVRVSYFPGATVPPPPETS